MDNSRNRDKCISNTHQIYRHSNPTKVKHQPCTTHPQSHSHRGPLSVAVYSHILHLLGPILQLLLHRHLSHLLLLVQLGLLFGGEDSLGEGHLRVGSLIRLEDFDLVGQHHLGSNLPILVVWQHDLDADTENP